MLPLPKMNQIFQNENKRNPPPTNYSVAKNQNHPQSNSSQAFQSQLRRPQIDIKMEQERKNIAKQKYRFPATIKGALLHQKALQFGYNVKKKKNVMCACCQCNVDVQKLEISEPTEPDIKRSTKQQIKKKEQQEKQKRKNLNLQENQKIQFTQTSQNTQSDDQKFKLSSSVALFFSFVRMAIIYFLLRLVIASAFNLFISSQFGKQCGINYSQCKPHIYKTFSSYNLHNSNSKQLITILDILNLVVTLASIPFFLRYRKIQYQLYDIIDLNVQTQDDYTVLIENIPILDFPNQVNQNKKIVFQYKSHLQNVINEIIQPFRHNWKKGKDQNVGTIERDFYNIVKKSKSKNNQKYAFSEKTIKSISFCYDLEQMEKINRFRQELMNQHQAQILQQEDSVKKLQTNTYKYIPKRIEYLNEAQIALTKNFSTDSSTLFSMTHFIGYAFVSLEYQHYKQLLIRQSEKLNKSLVINNHQLIIKPASSPQDIFWNNLKVSHDQRKQKIIVSFFILGMVLTFAFAAVLGLDFMKRDSQPNKKISTLQSIVNQSLSIIATIFILVINKFLQSVSISLTKYQMHETRSNYLFSLIIKLVASQFANNAMIYFIISIIRRQQHFLSQTGLVIQVSGLIVVSGCIQIFTNFLFPSEIIRNLKLWWKYRKLSPSDQTNKFQLRLNKQFEYIQFDISARYAYYLLQVLTVSFYSYIVPIGIPVLIVIFCVQYWVDKFNLFKRSSLKYQMDFFLSRMVLKVFQTSIFICSAGNFAFSFYLLNHPNNTYQISYINLAGLIISFIYVVIILTISQYSERKYFESYQKYQRNTHSQCVQKARFEYTFWKQNPATNLVQEKYVTNYDNSPPETAPKYQVYQPDNQEINNYRYMRQLNRQMEQEWKGQQPKDEMLEEHVNPLDDENYYSQQDEYYSDSESEQENEQQENEQKIEQQQIGKNNNQINNSGRNIKQ